MKSEWVDAHGHLADPRLDASRPQVLERARAAGIRYFVQGGVGPEDWDRQLRLRDEFPGAIFPVFGIHPWWIAERDEEQCRAALGQLPEYLGRGAVALGETGLDRGPRVPESSWGLQEEFFRAQLEIARKLDKPLILHIVRAHDLALKVMEEVGLPSRPGLVHAFTGSGDLARRYLERGFCLSIGGPLARKGFETLKRAVVSLPLTQLVVESDAPDQPSPAFAGGLNEPLCIREVAQKAAELKGLSVEEVLSASRANLERVLNLKF